MEPTTTQGGTSTSDTSDTSVYRIADLLIDTRRSRVLERFVDRAEPVDLEALARETASTVAGSESEEAMERTAIELHHVHLPKLAAAGLVDYDSERRVVAAATDGIDQYLRLARRISSFVESFAAECHSR